MKSIVVAIDFSDGTQSVIQKSCEMAVALGAALHVVHVIDNTPLYTMYGMHPEEIPSIVEYRDVARARAEEKLCKIKDDLIGQHGVLDSHFKVLEGAAIDELLEYAVLVHGVMIVAGTHGHSAIGSVLMGSVASGLVRKAKIPVLVVPVGTR